jgi:DNA-directed RNA polymerase specialized sigma24 family protein
MRIKREINPEAFEKMLLWLDENRDVAGSKYEAIRLRLIKIFDYRRCTNSEELTDIVFDRVLKKIDENAVPIDRNAVSNDGNPALYFFKVANNIYRENLRKPITVELPDDIALDEAEDSIHPYYECLKKCLKTLSDENRNFIVGYYEEEKQAKINLHKKLAQSLGIQVKRLHSRAFRIRASLQKCVLKCVKKDG